MKDQETAVAEGTSLVNAVRRLRWLALLFMSVLAVLTLGLAAEAYRVVFGANLNPVIEGKFYRSAQLSPSRLRKEVHRHGFKTIINLRGFCPEMEWYLDEAETLKALGIRQVDVALSSYTLPPVPELCRLVQELETCDQPVLIHCRRGSDRSGLISACVILLNGGSLAEARKQLSWRYGHVKHGRSGELGIFLDLYEEWLDEIGATHTPTLFRRWVEKHYLPLHCWARIEPLAVPRRVRVNRIAAMRFRCHNRSRHEWQFRSAANIGIHLKCEVFEQGNPDSQRSGAGYFDAAVPPGGSIDITLALPLLKKPGKYWVRVDLYDEKRGWFHAFGSPPYEMELEVHEVEDGK